MCCVCVIFTYVIEGIDLKVISEYLINDYSHIADLHIRSISLKLNNFGFDCTKRCYWDGCNFTRRNLDIFVSGWLEPLGK